MEKIIHRRGILKPTNVEYTEAEGKMERDRIIGPDQTEVEGREKDIEEVVDVALFDWDGVFYDSLKKIARAAVEVCKHHGIELTEKEFHRTAFQPYWEHYKRLGIHDADTEERKAYMYQLYHDSIMPKLHQDPELVSRLYPEVPETIIELQKRKIRVGIISAHKPDDIARILSENGIRDHVDFLVGLAHSKTEAIKDICERNNLDPKRVLMFGDLPSDLSDARSAGIQVAAVARLEGSADRLGAFDPDYLFESVGPEIFKLKRFVDNNHEE